MGQRHQVQHQDLHHAASHSCGVWMIQEGHPFNQTTSFAVPPLKARVGVRPAGKFHLCVYRC